MMDKGILIIDDEEWNISKLTELLARYNSPVFFDYVSSGEDALCLLKEKSDDFCSYSALITDHNIGDLTGKEILQIIRGEFNPKFAIGDLNSLEDLKGLDPFYSVISSIFGNLESYCRMVEQNQDMVKVMFSSTLYGDGYNDWILSDVSAFQKSNRSVDKIIEVEILKYLTGEGILDHDTTNELNSPNFYF